MEESKIIGKGLEDIIDLTEYFIKWENIGRRIYIKYKYSNSKNKSKAMILLFKIQCLLLYTNGIKVRNFNIKDIWLL